MRRVESPHSTARRPVKKRAKSARESVQITACDLDLTTGQRPTSCAVSFRAGSNPCW
jgi:hypothetical protein